MLAQDPADDGPLDRIGDTIDPFSSADSRSNLEQITDADYYQWLDWGLWGLLALCVAAVIAGGATVVVSGHNQASRTWGLRMVAAGLVGALTASALSQLVRFSADLIT